MLQRLVVILILCFTCALNAQGEANVWYFGENAGLDFNSGTPVALTNGALVTNEGCASISDSVGNLLFYTDGVTVYNNNHTIMPNGNGLNGDSSSTHSAIIVPKPGNNDEYYIFTVDRGGQSDGLQYSQVNMNLDNGLGDVVSGMKNVFLVAPTTEKVTAIKKIDSDEYWVVSHKWNSDEFVAYNITSNGVNTTPIITSIGSNLTGQTANTTGQMKMSPDGTKLVIANNGNHDVQLLDFDPNIGQFSNLIDIIASDSDPVRSVYGVEFSSNSKVLYVSTYGGVYQYNLAAGSPSDIVNSEVPLIILQAAFSSVQLAPNNKIYIARNQQFYIDVIENPNVVGLGCNYQLLSQYLGGNRSRLGLPTFIQSFLKIEDDIQFENVCNGDATQFSLSNAVDSATWNFGNSVSGTNNTSTALNPTHVYTGPGTYDVSVTVMVGTQSVTSTTSVTIYEQPTATAIPNQVFCDNDQDGSEIINLAVYTSTILNGQNPADFSITYYDGLANYNSNVPLNPPEFDLLTLANASPIASVRNVNNPDCEAITTINVSVLEGANPSQNVPSLEFCDNTSFGTDTDGIIVFDLTQNENIILNGQSSLDFMVSYYTDAVLTNLITNPVTYQNTNTTETIYVEVSNTTNSICSAQTNFDIQVFALPIINTVAQLSQCDDDLDGFSAFNLNEVNDEITANAVNEVITFHETQLEADSDTNPISNSIAYINQVVSTDIVWARIENVNGCFRTSQVNLFVSTTQIPLNFTRDFYECDNALDGDNTNGISVFDFSTVNTEIQGIFPTGQQLIISYYTNQADALAENNPITDISNHTNVGSPNTQNIYIRVDSAVDNDCLGLGEHITLHVEAVPQVSAAITITTCDEGNDGTEAFDTATIHNDLLNGQTNVSIVYQDAIGNVLSNPLPNPLVTGTQTITATLTNDNSLDPDGACSTVTTIAFILDPGVVANSVSDFIVCDDNNDGLFAFDTSTIQNTILNGQTGVTVTYTDEANNALSSPLPNPFTTTTQSITVRVENETNASCFNETTINFIVNDQPVANTVQDDFVCDDTSNGGEHIFNLSDYDNQVLNGQSTALFTVSYHALQTDAETNNAPLNNTYLSTVTSETIFVRIENNNNTSCFDTTSFQIGVSYLPIASQPDNISICDDASNDGFETVNLSVVNNAVLNGQSSTENIISYHLSQEDADNNANAINSAFTNTETPQSIFVRLENNTNSNCFSTTQFSVIVNEQPVLDMETSWTICEDGSVEIEADAGYDEYSWSTGDTTRIITVLNSGTYTVTASNNYGSLTCDVTTTITVVESNIATITNIETIDWSQNNNAILVEVEGSGDYEYSLDGLTYQDSNQFNNLSIDDYTVYIRDKNGCGVTSEEVYLLFYPNYFTPNGDTFHDTWQIYNTDKEPNNEIYIFDRYGKLLTQIKTNGLGWDGIVNGKLMPTSDYWFLLKRQNGKQYRGHFTLRR